MMNIRKPSPAQNRIQNQTRGQTPPPGSQLRHYEETQYPQFQPGHQYQPQQHQYLEMSKPAPGRVPGGPAGLPQSHQGFQVSRGAQPDRSRFQGHRQPFFQNGITNYGMMADNQDQQSQMWNQVPQQSSYFQMPAPNQGIRQQRMPMNNNQMTYHLPGMPGNMPGMAFLPNSMAPSYSSNQPMQFMQNPNSQIMYAQPRMPFPAQIPQQTQPMSFMPQYGATNAPYQAPAFFPQPPMAMAPNRPASTGPQGPMGGPKPTRNRKMLSLTDPNTGEDLTEKVFKPTSVEDTDPAASETQAHREAVHLEFATKVAFLAKDKQTHVQDSGSHAIPITAPPPQQQQQQQQHQLSSAGPPEPHHHQEAPPTLSHPPPQSHMVGAHHHHGPPLASQLPVQAPPFVPPSMHEPPPSTAAVAPPAQPPHMGPGPSPGLGSTPTVVQPLMLNGEAEGGNIPAPFRSSAQPPPQPFVPASAPPAPAPAPTQPEFQSPAQTPETVTTSADVQTPSPATPSSAAVVPEVTPSAPAAAVAQSLPVKEVSPPPPAKESSPSPPPPTSAESVAPSVPQEKEKSVSPPAPSLPEPEVPTSPTFEKESPPPPAPSSASLSPSPASPSFNVTAVPSPSIEATAVSTAEAANVVDETASAPQETVTELPPRAESQQISKSMRKKNKKRRRVEIKKGIAEANLRAQERGKQAEQQAQQQQVAQAASSQPQPQMTQSQPQRDGKKSGKKQRREQLNKKNKEGDDMEAYMVNSQNAGGDTGAELPTSSSSSPPPSSPPAATEAQGATEAAAASVVAEVKPEPSTSPKVAEETPTPAPAPAPAPVAAVSEPEPREPSVSPPVAEAPQPAQAATEASKEASPEASSSSPALQEEEESPAEEAPKDEEAKASADNGQEANGEVTEKEKYMGFLKGMGISKIDDEQWAPHNPEGKRQYDRNFLLKLQGNKESRKAPQLPHMPEIAVDPKTVRTDELRQRAQLSASQNPDFTPGFFKSSYSNSRGTPSLTKRPSQQRGGRGGPPSQSGEQRIILSTRQEVKLHKTENAYRPNYEEKTEEELETIMDTKEVIRKFNGILNKMTPEKFEKLVNQALKLPITTEERLVSVTNLIFEKAIFEPKFSGMYASFCCKLQKSLKSVPKLNVPVNPPGGEDDKRKAKGNAPGPEFKEVNFRGVLLTGCQREFEKDKEADRIYENFQKKLAEGKMTDLQKEEMQMEMRKSRMRTLGNMRFIGELFRLKMLTENIMHDCIFKLLKQRDDDSIECLTKLLETVGKDLDHPKAKTRMDQYFVQLQKMVPEGRITDSHSGKDAKPKKDELSSRVKFYVRDVLDMRRNGWNKRKIQEQNQPQMLKAVHDKHKEEQLTSQYLNNQHMNQDYGNSGGGSRGSGARPKGRGSAQGDADGWNTVPARPVKQSIDVTKMKLSKPVDSNKLSLGGGAMFRSWGQGSSGGSKSQEQDKQPQGNRARDDNRYSALNTLDNDGRRGFNRSPARDSRGSASARGDRDMDRRDRDRDYRKTSSRASMEDRERALAATRSFGASGGSSKPSSRNGSRDNSRSRDVARAPVRGGGMDASRMSEDELDRRIKTIAEEFVNNGNMKDTLESIGELKNMRGDLLVFKLVEKLIEKTSEQRKILGELLMTLVKEQQVTAQEMEEGLTQFMECMEDLVIDIPKIWDNMADILGQLLLKHELMPLTFLRPCAAALQVKANRSTLVSKTIDKAVSYAKSKDVVIANWVEADLKVSEFGLNEEEYKWLKATPRGKITKECLKRLTEKNSAGNNAYNNEQMIEWIEKNYEKEVLTSQQFVREFFIAFCKSVIFKKKEVNKELVKERAPLVMRYVKDRESGTEALFAMQAMLNDLEHPQGLARTLFELCYDEDIIAEESFYDWEARENTSEDKQGKGVVKLNVKDFLDWLKSGPEEERTS